MSELSRNSIALLAFFCLLPPFSLFFFHCLSCYLPFDSALATPSAIPPPPPHSPLSLSFPVAISIDITKTAFHPAAQSLGGKTSLICLFDFYFYFFPFASISRSALFPFFLLPNIHKIESLGTRKIQTAYTRGCWGGGGGGGKLIKSVQKEDQRQYIC